jgi:hypothetical protein
LFYKTDLGFQNLLEISGAREAGSSYGGFISCEEALKSNYRGIWLACEVEAMGRTVLPCKPRDPTKAKRRKLLLKSIRLQDAPDTQDRFLIIVVHIRLIVLLMQTVWVREFPV